MEIIYLVGGIWLVLLLRSVFAELHFYKTVKTQTPELWEQIGTHISKLLPIVFVSKSGKTLLENTTNNDVKQSYQAHRRAGRDFLAFIGFVLIAAILFLKLA